MLHLTKGNYFTFCGHVVMNPDIDHTYVWADFIKADNKCEKCLQLAKEHLAGLQTVLNNLNNAV